MDVNASLRPNFVFGIDKRFPSFGLYLKFGVYRIFVYEGFCLDRFTV